MLFSTRCYAIAYNDVVPNVQNGAVKLQTGARKKAKNEGKATGKMLETRAVVWTLSKYRSSRIQWAVAVAVVVDGSEFSKSLQIWCSLRFGEINHRGYIFYVSIHFHRGGKKSWKDINLIYNFNVECLVVL